jgi:hypothetical protein
MAAAERGDSKAIGAIIRSFKPQLVPSLARAGAWNARGWITFTPDTARAMLVNAGAYKPDPIREVGLLDAKRWATYMNGNTVHEVQHSVTPPSPSAYRGDARWMEEGTANVLSRTPVIAAHNARQSGINTQAYEKQLSAPQVFDPEWDMYVRPKLSEKDRDKSQKDNARNYGDSQVVLRDLVRLAGGDFRSTAGRQRAYDLLQGKSMRFTAGVLAKAIIEHHELDPSVYERLRTRIAGAVDLKGGAAAIAREFEIG